MSRVEVGGHHSDHPEDEKDGRKPVIAICHEAAEFDLGDDPQQEDEQGKRHPPENGKGEHHPKEEQPADDADA